VKNPSSIHLSQIGYGGAWNAACRIQKAIQDLGSASEIECEVDNQIKGLKIKNRLFPKLDYEIQQLTSSAFGISTFRGFGNSSWYKSLKNTYKETDIWNLHWMPGKPNLELSYLLKNKNIVWTLHDANPFTGVCHYSLDCKNFTKSCGECPQVPRILQSIPKYILKEKRDLILNSRNLVFVAPSNWIMKEFKKSSLGNLANIERIPNPIPECFMKDHTHEISINKVPVVTLLGKNYAGAKNSSLSAMALLAFLNKHPSIKIGIQIIGDAFEELNGYKQICLPQRSSPEALARFLKSSDILIYTSLADNLPNLVLEAQAAGNVVIGLRKGGVPECFIPEITGFIADENPEEICEKIFILVSDESLINKMKILSTKFVQKNFSYEYVGRKYLDLYETLLQQSDMKAK
jgi:glycosyltransferase involved in cell wall biosynthesis